MLSKPCGELYCHALSSCDMCGRLPFSTEYKSGVSGPQGAGAALCVLWGVYLRVLAPGVQHLDGGVRGPVVVAASAHVDGGV